LSESEKRYAQNPDFIYRRIVDEMILVPIHQDIADLDCIYSLNSLGAFIWEQLETPATRHELGKAIQAEFDTDERTIQRDLDPFLQEMVLLGAIRVN